MAKLTERIDGLVSAVEKLAPNFERALDKHALDVKERIAEIKMDAKETRDKLYDVKESIAAFKGAMKIFGGLYALALVLVAAFLAWFLRPTPQVVAPSANAAAFPGK